MENFKEAWLKAIRGKSGKPDVAIFRADFENNLERLRMALREGSFGFGGYEYFTISDPKKRLICAASFPERIVHHAMMNTLDQVFERFQISDSHACRKGKGTQAAVLRGFHFVKGKRFFLKMDIRKYFDSIDHAVLKGATAGAPFLGFILRPSGIFLSAKGKRQFGQKAKAIGHALAHGHIQEFEAAVRITAMIAHSLVARSRGFRYRVFPGSVLGRQPRESRRELEQ